MTMLTINLPEDVATRLKARAAARQQPLDAYVSEMLVSTTRQPDPMDLSLTFDEVVTRIRALPPRNLAYIQPPTGSLAEALARTVVDPNFDEAAWNREWAASEAEMKAIDMADQEADRLRDEPR